MAASKDPLKVVTDSFTEFRKIIRKETRTTIDSICKRLIELALWNRVIEPNAHEFTGNLINSIIVGYFIDGRMGGFYTAQDKGWKPSFYYKMTASHGKYFFKFDYLGRTSTYVPTVETEHTKGHDDAINFINGYSPTLKKGCEIVVAYTAEYASWVEAVRGTTGYLRTVQDTMKNVDQYFIPLYF